jgi:Tfp pilus assembly protein PilV
MLARLRQRRDQGETLIELLIAIAILGVCVVAIGSGIAGAVMVSGLHRDQADATRILHNYVETLEAAPYDACTSSHQATYTLATQSGFAAPVLTVAYWDGSNFVAYGAGTSPCASNADTGLQRVTISLSNTDSRVSQSLSIVLRNPA